MVVFKINGDDYDGCFFANILEKSAQCDKPLFLKVPSSILMNGDK